MYVRNQGNGYRAAIRGGTDAACPERSRRVRPAAPRKHDPTNALYSCILNPLSTKMLGTPLATATKSQPARALSASAAKLRLLKTLKCTLRYEKRAWAAGATLVAGVDEVGRGSLFGAVVAAAVILDPAYRVRGLRDSKLLEPERRVVLAERIREHAVCWAVAAVDAARIDQINIYQGVAGGDARCGAAACACAGSSSRRCAAPRLRAESGRDHSWGRAVGVDRGRVDSGQGGARSHDVRVGRGVSCVWSRVAQGYSTPKHLAALREFGPTPLHRQSFAPVWQNPVPQEAFGFMSEEEPVDEVNAGDLAG